MEEQDLVPESSMMDVRTVSKQSTFYSRVMEKSYITVKLFHQDRRNRPFPTFPNNWMLSSG